VVREFIQHFATPEALSEEALRLLNDPSARIHLVSSVNEIVSTLEAQGAASRASHAILAAL
jgi:lipid A disaccharide synthetase